MGDVVLVEPNIAYKQSFLEFVQDVKNTGYESYEHYINAEKDFERFVQELSDSSKGINLPKGWVPCSSYWLVKDGQVIGVIRIRHRVDTDFLQMIGHIGYEIKSSHRRKGYGTKMLELGLIKAQRIGLDKVLITCNENNLGSIKIIKKFNGVYKKSILDEESGEMIMQFEVCTK